MQLIIRILLFILLMSSIGCSPPKKKVNKEILWQSFFNYLDDRHFILEMPPPPPPISQQEQKFRRLCSDAVIHINNEEIEYPKEQLKEIEKFFNHPVTEQMIKDNISEEDFLLVDMPISFQNFGELSRDEKFFTKKQKCGVSVCIPIIRNDKAVLQFGIITSPLSGEGYLLFLKYNDSKKLWEVVEENSLYVI